MVIMMVMMEYRAVELVVTDELKGPILCWTRCRTCIPKTKESLYVIVGPLQVPPTQLLTACLATALKNVNDFGLRKPFYSKQMF